MPSFGATVAKFHFAHGIRSISSHWILSLRTHSGYKFASIKCVHQHLCFSHTHPLGGILSDGISRHEICHPSLQTSQSSMVANGSHIADNEPYRSGHTSPDISSCRSPEPSNGPIWILDDLLLLHHFLAKLPPRSSVILSHVTHVVWQEDPMCFSFVVLITQSPQHQTLLWVDHILHCERDRNVLHLFVELLPCSSLPMAWHLAIWPLDKLAIALVSEVLLEGSACHFPSVGSGPEIAVLFHTTGNRGCTPLISV